MVEQPSANGYEQTSSPADLANSAVVIGDPAPLFGSAVGKRKRTVSSKPTLTVSLVIPVKNEARNIASVLEQIAGDISEVILVDGNSTDATLITARSCRPDIKIVPQDGTGKGSALRSGFLAATGDIIVMMDADGSMVPQEIRHYVHFFPMDTTLSRVHGSSRAEGRWTSPLFGGSATIFCSYVFNTLYDTHLTDLCYGFCAFHRRYLELLALSATGFEIEAEMVVRATQAGLRIAEVPSFELPRRAGKSNLHSIRDGCAVLRTVLREHRSGISGHLVQSVRKSVHAGNHMGDTE